MNNEVICPACGSKNVTKKEKQTSKQLTLGPEFSFSEIVYQCNDCKEEGDFNLENDSLYTSASKDAEKKAVSAMVQNINENGVSMAFFERAFELPIRTLTRWKTGDFSSASLALLRSVTTYPWLVEVAERKFNRNFANQVLLREAFNVLQNCFQHFDHSSWGVAISSNQSSFEVKAYMDLQKSNKASLSQKEPIELEG